MSKLRYGVIGVTGIGKYHIQRVMEDGRVELTALVDVDEESLRATASELRVRGFSDYRDMLDADVVDAVSIAVPHHLHAEIGLACLEAGVHIFLEKPFANRLSEVDAMLAEACARNLKICVGHQYRLHHSPQAMKRIIESGELGRIMQVLWTWAEFRPESYYGQDAWRKTWRTAGGGLLMNQASHDLDLICWMFGRPAAVSAEVINQLHDMELDDALSASMVFEDGVLATLQMSINRPRAFSIRQVVGDRGMLVMPDVRSLTGDKRDLIRVGVYEDTLTMLNAQLQGTHEQPGIEWRTVSVPEHRHAHEKLLRPARLWRRLGVLKKRKKTTGLPILLRSFVEAVLTDSEPLVSGASTRAAVELTNGILLSAVRRKPVQFPVDAAEYDELFEELCAGSSRIRGAR
ncbi:MAG: Gfo/Idh/MocA family oxidoreductase [Pseudomonadota bacterium]